jgi:hypothetical protein
MAHLTSELVSARVACSRGARRFPEFLNAQASLELPALRHRLVSKVCIRGKVRGIADLRHLTCPGDPCEMEYHDSKAVLVRLSSDRYLATSETLFPSGRMLSQTERNISADKMMYTLGVINTRATPVLTARLVWGISLRYTPLAHPNYARRQKKKLNHGGLRQCQQTPRLERLSIVARQLHSHQSLQEAFTTGASSS